MIEYTHLTPFETEIRERAAAELVGEDVAFGWFRAELDRRALLVMIDELRQALIVRDVQIDSLYAQVAALDAMLAEHAE